MTKSGHLNQEIATSVFALLAMTVCISDIVIEKSKFNILVIVFVPLTNHHSRVTNHESRITNH